MKSSRFGERHRADLMLTVVISLFCFPWWVWDRGAIRWVGTEMGLQWRGLELPWFPSGSGAVLILPVTQPAELFVSHHSKYSC